MDEEIIETNEDGEEASGSDLVKKLRERAREAEEKAQEYLTGWQKERAELANARRRDEVDKKEFAKYANENLIMELLPALDSFDMAMSNRESWKALPEQWTKGMEYIHSQLISSLESQGVKRIYPLHQVFNPLEHDALGTVEVERPEDENKIMEVIQPGYSYHDKQIRTAKVKVGEFKG
jgi:molecular chaperone GrpE